MTTGNVSVVGYRNLIEPPVLGDCDDPACDTVAVRNLRRANAPELAEAIGNGLLLVASYSTSAEERAYIRVCAACDERRLRAWLAD